MKCKKERKKCKKQTEETLQKRKKQNAITKHANDKFVLSKNGQIRQVVLL